MKNPSPKDLRTKSRYIRKCAYSMVRNGCAPCASYLFNVARRILRIARYLDSGCMCAIATCDCYCFASAEMREQASREFEEELYQEWSELQKGVRYFCEQHGILLR